MRKTKLSFDLSCNSMATTAYLRVSTGTHGPPSSYKSRSQRRPSPRLSASASHHLPLYQDKAVTPTPLKDIFTPIWAGPSYPTTNRPKSQNALRFEIIITFLYTVVSYWMSIGLISRNIRALKRRNSVYSCDGSPRPLHAKRSKPAKRLFNFVFVSNSSAK